MAVILVAGTGERLYPLTKDLPKCLIDIGGITILEHQLRNLMLNGIKDVILVTGYKAEKIEESVQNFGLSDMNIKLIYNSFFEVYNNLYSLFIALKEINSDFMIVNGDDVFHPDILKKLIEAKVEEITLMINKKTSYDSDDMKVTIKDEKIELVNKQIDSNKADGESIGIMKFTGSGVTKIKEMVTEMANTPEGQKVFYLKAIQNIANKHNIVGYVDIGDLPWGEIDYPEDLQYVKNTVMKKINTYNKKII